MNEATIYSIVGRRGHAPAGWSPGFGPAPYHRRMGRAAIPGFVLIGLGVALFVAAWAHYRGKPD